MTVLTPELNKALNFLVAEKRGWNIPFDLISDEFDWANCGREDTDKLYCLYCDSLMNKVSPVWMEEDEIVEHAMIHLKERMLLAFF